MSKPLPDISFKVPFQESHDLIFDEFVKIYKDRLINFQGKPYSYYTLETPAAAALILAQDENKRFVLSREYRHPTQEILLSLPGGYVDPGETPLEASQRELQEETGYTATDFQLMGRSYPYPGISSQSIYYVFAKNAQLNQPTAQETGELIETVLLSHSEILEILRAGYPVDGNLLTALFWYQTSISHSN